MQQINNNSAQGERAALFWVFLTIFTILMIVSILMITNAIQVDPNIKDKATYLLFGSLAVAVITLFKQIFLSDKNKEIELNISVIFAGANVTLDIDNCLYAVFDRNNKPGEKTALQIQERGNSWECIVRLTSVDESVRLYLQDQTGKKWSTANIGMKLIAAKAIADA